MWKINRFLYTMMIFTWFCCLSGGMVPSAQGAENTVVTVSEAAIGEDGTAKVIISLSGNPGIAGFQMQLLYNSSIIQYTKASKGEMLSSGVFMPNKISKSGQSFIKIIWADATEINGNGTLCTIEFKVLKSDSIKFDVQECLLLDEKTHELAVVYDNKTSGSIPAADENLTEENAADDVVQDSNVQNPGSSASSSGHAGSSSGGSSTTKTNTVIKPETKPANDSSDMNLGDMKGHWAEKVVNDLVTKNILTGYPDGTFRPQNSISRAEIAAILFKGMGMTAPGTAYIFGDQANIPAWAQQAIAAVAKEGLMSGYPQNNGDKIFQANAPISRAELAVIAGRILGKNQDNLTSASLTFTDASSIPSWAERAIALASSQGIVNGYPDNTFQANKPVTRAEAAAMLAKLFQQ